MRIRSIKPEFWRSDDVASLPWEYRLLFVGLWSYVDDNGVGDARVASIAADLFAADLSADTAQTLIRVETGLSELEQRGMILRYEGARRALVYITAWNRHQLVRTPSLGHKYPLPSADSPKADARSAQSPRKVPAEPDQTPITGTGEQGNRGTGDIAHGGAAGNPLELVAAVPPQPDRFAEFWATWPRKESKADAQRAWTKAVKTTDPSVILAAATAYAGSPHRSEREFVPYGATWLNKRRWEDPLPEGPEVRRPVQAFDPDAHYAWLRSVGSDPEEWAELCGWHGEREARRMLEARDRGEGGVAA